MVGLAVVGALGGMSNGIFATRVGQGFGADLRGALFRKVQSLSFGNLDELETGQLVTRLTNDVTHLQEAVMMLLRMLIRAPLQLVGSLIMVVVTSPQLAFIPLALIPLLLAVIIWVVRKATPMFGLVQAKLDTLNEVMQENLAGVRVVKAFVRADYEMSRFGATNESLMNQFISVGRVTTVLMPVMMTMVNLGVAGAMWFGGVRVTQGNMQVGQIVAFVNYLLITLFSLMTVSMMIIQVSRAQASAERIDEVLLSVPKICNKPQAVRQLAPQSQRDGEHGRVTFEHVSFGYDGDGPGNGNGHGMGHDAMLKDLSFVAEPGQMVAIIGTTGSGKSTLVHLIPRLYDVSAGRVTVGGYDVRDLDYDALRRRVGIAMQETVLFSGTIRDNIRYGRPEATDEEVVAAAKMAQAHDFILSFPEGYDTELGQRGVNVSGGQKQRIAIARALLIQPEVLILDDSTSSVDMETEAKIQEALRGFMRGRTCFVIAQRISGVLNADKILVLDEGRIVAEGTHEALFASSPIYREICESQWGDGATSHG
jgi:ATP-binding cassette subfamily B multidrug efflux pump